MRTREWCVATLAIVTGACLADEGRRVGPSVTSQPELSAPGAAEIQTTVPPPTAPMTVGADPEQLRHIEWGVITSPNSVHGELGWFMPVTLFNVGPGEVQLLSLSLGPALRGEGSLVGFFRFTQAFHSVMEFGLMTDPLPDFVEPFVVPATIAPIDVGTAQTSGRPQDDPNAVRVVVQVRFDGGEEFLVGELSATYRLSGGDQIHRVVLQPVVGSLCAFAEAERCFPHVD